MKTVQGWLHDILSQYAPDAAASLMCLFQMAYLNLKAAEIGTPIAHVLIVLENAFVITRGTANQNDPLLVGATSLLHDIWPGTKRRKGDEGGSPGGSPAGVAVALEQMRMDYRKKHMHEGARVAREMMAAVNDYYGRPVFGAETCRGVSDVIEAHDLPSIGVSLPVGFAREFRQADRLAMLSEGGFANDIALDRQLVANAGVPDAELARRRVAHVLKRFAEERELYTETDGPFFGGMFFTNRAAYDLCLQLLEARRAEHGS
jgi:hypothetical protein